MLSAFYVRCINSSSFQTRFIMEGKPYEQSDLGPYGLQYRLPKNIGRREEQTTKVVTCRKRVNFKLKIKVFIF